MPAPEKQITARRVVVTSFFVDLIDVISSLVVAILSGSVVMLAQVLQGLADLASAGFLVLGVKQSTKPTDKKHPFGHGREIFFWATLSALMMFGITASLSFYFGLQRFLRPETIENISFAYVVLSITTVTNGYSFTLSLRRLKENTKGKNLWQTFMHSPLIETKTTLILDLMGTSASILGLAALLLFGLTKNLRFDGLGAMLIGAVLGIMALVLIKSAKDLLIGKGASMGEATQIREAALAVAGVKDVLDLRTMYMGPENLLVNLEVHVQDNLTTDEIEMLVDKIKTSVKSGVPSAGHIQVELETP